MAEPELMDISSAKSSGLHGGGDVRRNSTPAPLPLDRATALPVHGEEFDVKTLGVDTVLFAQVFLEVGGPFYAILENTVRSWRRMTGVHSTYLDVHDSTGHL